MSSEAPEEVTHRSGGAQGNIAEALTLDEQARVEPRGRLEAGDDRIWREGQAAMRYCDVQRVRRVFGRRSDEFCRKVRYDRTIKDAAARCGIRWDGVAQVSDDTQMMLFTLEGLIRAHVARRMKPTGNDPVPEVQHAYQRWFHAQGPEWRTAGGPHAQHLQRPDGWLITNWELFASRAPGSTCMSALANFAQTGVSAAPRRRINDSKGCGGVMRAAPVAVWSNDPAEVFYAAVGTAALTHSHPSGFLSAGVLAVIVHH